MKKKLFSSAFTPPGSAILILILILILRLASIFTKGQMLLIRQLRLINKCSEWIQMNKLFLPDPGVSGVQSMGLGLSMSLSPGALVDFVDVTLADDDTNSILLMMPI